MFIIYRFQNGRIIKEATDQEYSRYLEELSKKSKDHQLSGEVKSDAYGLAGLIYMQEISDEKTKKNSHSTKCEITYFDVAGKENSDETLELQKREHWKEELKQ